MLSQWLQLCRGHAVIYYIKRFTNILEAYINLYTSIEEFGDVISGCEEVHEAWLSCAEPMLGAVENSVSLEMLGNLIKDDAFDYLAQNVYVAY